MTLNAKKSGILLLKNSPQAENLEEFPYVSEYKYLGTYLTGDLSPDCHLRNIGRKADYQARQLAPLRHCLDMRFNVNLFKMLILPSVRLLGNVHRHANIKEKEKVEIHVRKRLRAFCLLPWTCPNEFVEMLIGSTQKVLNGLARATDHKINCRRAGMVPDRYYLR